MNQQPAGAPDAARAVASLYHNWITGLVLTLLNRRNAQVAEEFVFRLFRRQHLQRFLPGLEKLGLADAPHAAAAAKYHYLSNQLGGVSVEYLEESDVKAWTRFPPPRWIWMGSAICAIPSGVNRAMLRGWHAHSGVTLGNPRLGFVCTGTTVDGQPGLEGYYREATHELGADERLVFAPQEHCPPIDPKSLPTLDHEGWPEARRAKAYRNYAMEYLRNGLPVLTELLGAEEARYLGRISALQIGMHGYRDTAAQLGIKDDSSERFIELLAALLEAQGETVSRGADVVTQAGWRLFRAMPTPHRAVLEACAALFEGLWASHNRHLSLRVELNSDGAEFRVTS
jgi:hypothetical protein